MFITVKLRIAFFITFLFSQQVKCIANTTSIIEYDYASSSDDITNVLDIIESNRSCLLDSIPTKKSALGEFVKYGNPDKYLNITQLVQKYGYPIQEHIVLTEDGYILKMFRIPKEGAPVVFLMHGLLGSADDWITPGPETGIGYLLASAGYDVWMGNARGNKHSRRHKTLSPDHDKKRFWDFSWDEIGRYDLAAMIDYVLAETGVLKLNYVGHSQGTTSFYVLCSERPEYNNKISVMVSLSAVAWMSHMTSPLIRIFAPAYPLLDKVCQLFGTYEVIPNTKFRRALTDLFCGTAAFAVIICSNLTFLLFGFDYNQLNVKSLPVIYSHVPSGASIKQLVHYAQGIESGDFRPFDYGDISKNREKYKARKPPSYPVENITAPVAIFYSHNDWMANIADVNILKSKLPNVIDFYEVPHKKFNHLDYVWGKDIRKLVFNRLLKLLKNNNT